MVADGDLYRIYTAGHVPKVFPRGQTINIPEAGTFPIHMNTQTQWRRDGERDSGTFFTLSREEAKIINNRLNVLKPLVIDSVAPGIGQTLAIPILDLELFLFFETYDPGALNKSAEELRRLNFVAIKNKKNYALCVGQSGTPVLKVEGGKVTNKVAGVLCAVSGDPGDDASDPLGKERRCGLVGFIRLNGI